MLHCSVLWSMQADAGLGVAAIHCEGKNVKLIIATIKPLKLEEVREALTTVGVRGIMVSEIKGF